MMFAIIKILLGIFVWRVLPRFIINKRKYKKNMSYFFVNIVCKIIGIAMICFAVIDLVQLLLLF